MKKIIFTIALTLLVVVVGYNVYFAVDYTLKNRTCDGAEEAYILVSHVNEEPLAAYVVGEPNKLLLPFKGQAEKLEADMTLREVIAKIGKPQRYIGNAETGEIILQWDLQFNKKANIAFNELADPEIYRWCDRLTLISVTVE